MHGKNNRPNEVCKERALPGFDGNIGGNSGCWPKILDLFARVPIVKTHSHNGIFPDIILLAGATIAPI